MHPDMRGHTGGNFSMGKGTICGASLKHKFDTRSSTEAEVVSVDQMISQVIWTRLFLEAQGYQVKNNILYQDNKSAQLLETNGTRSSGKRTRHMNIRFFFIADKVASGEISVEHCPAELMVADFFTKPLQGELFYRFRRMILNLDDSEDEN